MVENSGGQQPDAPMAIGRVAVLYGEVRAMAGDGSQRLLQPDSPVFAGEVIVTGPDGMVSIIFDDQLQTQLDLGRMSEVLLDDDVHGGTDGLDLQDAVSEVEDIQQALLEPDFDPTLEEEPPAAGPFPSGGDHYYVKFDAIGAEVLPDNPVVATDSTSDFSVPEPVAGENRPPAAADLLPVAEADQAQVLESTAAPGVTEGNLLQNDGPGDGVVTVTGVEIGGVSYTIAPGQTITHTTPLGGQLTVSSDGAYTYSIQAAILHETHGQGDGLVDQETFIYTITDGDGDSSRSTLTVHILDSVPQAGPDANMIMEGGEDGAAGTVSGNVIFGWDDGRYEPAAADSQGADQGLHLVQVEGDLAPGVTFALDTPLATALGGTIIFHSDGSYLYTAPDRVDNPLNGDGHNQSVSEQFTYTVEDRDGSPASAVLTVTVVDSAPVAVQDSLVVEEGPDSQVSGNVLVNDQTGADGTLQLVGVSGDFAAGVSFALDTELATAQGGTIIFHADGSFTYTAPASIDHGDLVPDRELFFCQVEDGDGSRDSSTLSISITDDQPSFTLTPTILLANETGNSVTADLGIDFGADGAAPAGESVQLVGTTDAHGYVVNNSGHLLSSDGQNLIYQDDGQGSLVALREFDHQPVFTVSIDPETATWTVSLDAIHALDQTLVQDIGETVNADNPLELHFDAPVSSMSVTLEGLDSVTVMDTVYSEQAVWTAYLEGEQVATGLVNGDLLLGQDQVLTLDLARTGSPFDTVVLEYDDSPVPLMGDYRVVSVSSEMNHSLSFDVLATDGDGDTVSGRLDVVLDGDGDILGTPGPDVIGGSTEADILVGGDGDDLIMGQSGNDILFGSSGNDSLDGGKGNDTLVGGPGDDILVGSEGDDVLFGGDAAGMAGAGNDSLTGDGVADSSDPGSDLFADAGGDLLTDGADDPGDTSVDDLVPPPEPTV
ncbi:Ig-like domain-containing protein [Desulfolithobacter sp.]